MHLLDTAPNKHLPARDLRAGMKIIHRGLDATVTHSRKHRSYAGYQAVQVQYRGSDTTAQLDIKGSELVEVVQ